MTKDDLVASHFECFLKMEIYSCTSSGEPSTTGTLWWIESGLMSRTFIAPVVAIPPACSMMKAMGLHSYNSLSWSPERNMKPVRLLP